jgi:hypothetical protein
MLKTKDKFYVSFNQDEVAIMLDGDMTLEEHGLYFLLKTIANFTTGIFGKFRQQKMSYAELGRRLSRPASQGRAARTFDASHIVRLLERLEAKKLVADRHIEDRTDRLVMRLPLSPIDKNPLPEVATTTDKKLPQENLATSPAKADGARPSAVSSDTPSVLFSQRENKPFSDIVNTDGAESRPRLDPLKVGTAEGPLTAAAIEAVMQKAGSRYASTDESRIFYRAWVRRGLTHRHLDDAILLQDVLGGGIFTPADLDLCLYPKPVAPRHKGASINRDKVL